MSENAEIVIVFGDDWEGLFFNGRLVTEGHEIDTTDFADIVMDVDYCDGRLTRFARIEADQVELAAGGGFPADLRHVILAEGVMLPANLDFSSNEPRFTK